MEKFYVGFSKASGPWTIFSKIIQLIDGVPFSHVYLKLYDPSIDETFVFQASGTSVNIVNYSLFLEKHVTVAEYALQVEASRETALWKFCIENLGKPYGFKELLGLGLVKLFALFGERIHNPFRAGRQAYVCCELIAYLLKDRLNYYFSKDLDDLTPKDIFELFENRN